VAIDPHVRLLGWSEGVVHAVAPGTIEADAIRGIGREELGFGAIEESGHGVGVSGVTARQPMITEEPEIPELRSWGASCFRQCLIEIEALDLLALLASL
jgi:hypothetical protein